VSEHGIMLDPMKVEEILRLPLSRNIQQIQGLQGKANLLRRFIVNSANLTKGFMCLLKKDTLLYGISEPKNPSMLLRNLWYQHLY
jgi:hypothetical protein